MLEGSAQELTAQVRAKLHAVAILGDAAFKKSVVKDVQKSYQVLQELYEAKVLTTAAGSKAPACAGAITQRVPLDWAELPTNSKKPHDHPKGKTLLFHNWGPFLLSIPDLYEELQCSQLCEGDFPSVADMRAFGYLHKLVQIEKKKREVWPLQNLFTRSHLAPESCMSGYSTKVVEHFRKGSDGVAPEDSKIGSVEEIDTIMTAETRRTIFTAFRNPSSKLADYIWEHHREMWAKHRWNRLDELAQFLDEIDEVVWPKVRRQAPGEILNRIERDMKERAARFFSEREFLHLKHLPAAWALPGQPKYELQVLKSPHETAAAGLRLRNCAAIKIDRVRFKLSQIAVVSEMKTQKVVGMAEYVYESGRWRLKQSSAAANKPLAQELTTQLRKFGAKLIQQGMVSILPVATKVNNSAMVFDEVYEKSVAQELEALFDCTNVGRPLLSDRREISKASRRKMVQRTMGSDSATILLPLAAAAGDVELVKHLQSQGADPEYAATMRCDGSHVTGTAVMLAARLRQWNVVSTFIQACNGGASLVIKDSEDASIVQLAVDDQKLDILAQLCGRVPVLPEIARHGSSSFIPKFIKKMRSEPACDMDIDETDHHGRSALMWAVRGCHGSMVDFLLDEQGCSPNREDARGQTPLMTACAVGNQEIVESLLVHKAEVNPGDGRGKTPLTIACARGNWKIAETVLDFDANAKVAGSLPLSLCKRIVSRDASARKLGLRLLDSGAQPDFADNELIKLLEILCLQQDWELLIRLIERSGCRFHAKFDFRSDKTARAFSSALRAACKGGNPRLAKALLQLNVDATTRDAQEYTVLMSASWLGYLEIVEMLLNHAAAANTIDDTNEFGSTALTLALLNGHVSVAKLLLEKGADASKALKFFKCRYKRAAAEKLLKQVS